MHEVQLLTTVATTSKGSDGAAELVRLYDWQISMMLDPAIRGGTISAISNGEHPKRQRHR